MKPIWKVHHDGKDNWYPTQKEAKGFCDGAGLEYSIIERIEIGCYMNPEQTVAFLRRHFANCVAA